MAKSIESISLLDVLPPNLAEDDTIKNAAIAIDGELQKTTDQAKNCIHLSRIDELQETVLDLLAWQWHVDFYEPITMDLETKRKLIKQSIAWHRMKGTPAAVEAVVSAAFDTSTVQEWWEYGGKPYFFKVVTEDVTTEKDVLDRMKRAIESVKNARSWLEEIEFILHIKDELGSITESSIMDVLQDIVERYPWRDRRFDGGWNFTKPECYDGSWILDGDRYFNGTLPGDEDQIERGRVFDGEWQLTGEYNFMPHEYSRKILFDSAEEENLSVSAEINQHDLYRETLNFDSRERRYDGSWIFGPANCIQDNNFDESIELDQHDNETLDEDSGFKISAETAENYPYVRMQFFNGSWAFNQPQCFDGEYRFDGETKMDGAPYSTDPTATAKEFSGSWKFDGTEALGSSMIHVRFDADESAGDREVMNIASGYADTESLAEDENESVQLVNSDNVQGRYLFDGTVCFDGSIRLDGDGYRENDGVWSANIGYNDEVVHAGYFDGEMMLDGNWTFGRMPGPADNLGMTIEVGKWFDGSWTFNAGNVQNCDGSWTFDGSRMCNIRRTCSHKFSGSWTFDGVTRFARGGDNFEIYRYAG